MTSIGAGFLSRLFSSQSKVIQYNKKAFKIEKRKRFVGKRLDRKRAPIEVIISLFT